MLYQQIQQIMQPLLNDIDKLQQVLQTDCLLTGIVIGSIGTLLLLAIGHRITNKTK